MNAEPSSRGTPWLLGVCCDRPGCDTSFEGDFLVAEDATPGERLRVVLDWAENHGWRVIWRQPVKDSLAFCPDEASGLTALTEEGGPVVTTQRYQNALTWIRHVAGLHYLGGAFDPEHMRDLANMATAALQGKDFPDYAESMARGREKAAEWAALFATLADDHDGDEVPGEH